MTIRKSTNVATPLKLKKTFLSATDTGIVSGTPLPSISRLSCPACSGFVIRMKPRLFPSFILTVSTVEWSYLRTRNSATLIYITSS